MICRLRDLLQVVDLLFEVLEVLLLAFSEGPLGGSVLRLALLPRRVSH